MRFIILTQATNDTEAGVLPDKKLLTELEKYNEELVKAGVMLAGEGAIRNIAPGLRRGCPERRFIFCCEL